MIQRYHISVHGNIIIYTVKAVQNEDELIQMLLKIRLDSICEVTLLQREQDL